MGTSEFAVPALKKLAGTPCEVVAVVTQPDRPVGRKRILTAPPVKEEAVRHGLHVLQPEKAKDPLFIEEIRGLEPDIAIVASYGQILKKALLEAPRLGCLNIHGSLLPKYRGASPIQTAILEGESETGVTIMQMDAGLDTGDMLSKVITPIHDEDTAQTLHDRLAEMGGDLLMETLPLVLEGRLQPEKQDDLQASYAGKIDREDGWIDWTATAVQVWNKSRAFDPWPGAFSELQDGGTLRIWRCHPDSRDHDATPGAILSTEGGCIEVACGEGVLVIEELQKQGSRRMLASEFLSGARLGDSPAFKPLAEGK